MSMPSPGRRPGSPLGPRNPKRRYQSRSPYILIADDYPENLAVLRWTLRDVDATIIEASDGNQALAASAEHDLALAIIDVRMPVLDGFEVAELLRCEPRTQSLPIIFLTGSIIDEQNVFRGYEAGGVDYIIKPYNPKILLAKVELFLEFERQREELVLHREHLAELVEARTKQIQSLNLSLHQSRDRLRAALEQSTAIVASISDAVLVIDPEGIVLFANPASEQLLGRSPAELVGTRFGFPVEPGAGTELELEGDLDPRYAEMTIVEFEWQGKPAWLASLRDITAHRLARDLQARLVHADRLTSIGQLASGVAHEINNPAHFIMANLESMTQDFQVLGRAVAAMSECSPQVDALLSEHEVITRLDDLDEMVRDNLDGIHHIAKIVKDLRSFSYIDRDEIELVDLNEVVDVACGMTYNEIRHRARLVKEKGRLPRVAADHGKLAQVLINLLLNAAHAIEEGAAEDNLVRIRTSADGEQLTITVEDTGHGIPEQVRRRIFDPFFTTKPRDKGTGLGLSLSAEIMRQHGGEIEVESQEGKGTCFRLTLPVVTPLTADLPSGAFRSARPGPRVHARVLLIDDDPRLLMALGRVLSREHDVVIARGGAEALAILEDDDRFDVILCDLMMPQIDGLMVHEAIHEQSPHLLERVVFCSGGVFTERIKRFTSTISNICLDKPITAEQLLSVIEQVVRRRGG
ncbi:MAG: response regulator [Myxococcota bacterium]